MVYHCLLSHCCVTLWQNQCLRFNRVFAGNTEIVLICRRDRSCDQMALAKFPWHFSWIEQTRLFSSINILRQTNELNFYESAIIVAHDALLILLFLYYYSVHCSKHCIPVFFVVFVIPTFQWICRTNRNSDSYNNSIISGQHCPHFCLQKDNNNNGLKEIKCGRQRA